MIGQTISHYKIIEKLGEGGMGVVYKAQDTTLERFVALKFLPDHVSAGSNELERFVQEAKAAASLNHPNICTIYGIEEAEKKHFIVMEFVDGQTLQEKKNTLTQKQALDIGIQIADGLAAAHEKGIVHRDIKPENIMIRRDGIVQIMDFGLAKLRGASRLTKEGSTVGTAGYMSPEQVQGQDTDHRSDIFSLGVLLYEMLTGQIPFKGVHETAIAYEIVNVDSPPMSSLKPDITPELDAIILECLEKDPKERSQSASQIAVDLKRCRRESSRQRASRMTAARPALSSSHRQSIPFSGGQFSAPESEKRKIHPWAVTAAAAVVMLAAGYGLSFVNHSHLEKFPIVRASVNMPHGIRYNDDLGGHSVISPDGSMIAFVGLDSVNHSSLLVYSLQSNETKSLPGTEHATYPSWSVDSKAIAFFADGKLKTIDAKGGPVIELADAPFGRGIAWSSTGEILYSPSVSDPNLYVISSSGGTPKAVTKFDSTSGKAPRFPSFFPDGKHYIFTMLEIRGIGTNSDLYVGSTENSEVKKILSDCSFGRYDDGFLLYLRQGILIAQPFDPGSLSLSGKPFSVQGNINSWPPRAKADFSLSENGVLLYAVGSSSHANELLIFRTDGSESVMGAFQVFTAAVPSPNETLLAYDQTDTKDKTTSLWIYDIVKKTTSRFTFGNRAAATPCWSSDGRRLFYNAEEDGRKSNIYAKNADGSGEEELIAKDTMNVSIGFYPMDASPDGRYLLISVRNESGSELAYIDLSEKQIPHRVIRLGLTGRNARFSSDGKWILYQSNESASAKIFLSSFPGNAGTWQLPTDAGNAPFWEKGRIIFFSTGRDRYEYCTVSFSNGVPSFGQPQQLFTGKMNQSAIILAGSKNGNKYFGMRPANAGSASSLSVIVNWKGLVEKE